MLDIIGGIQPSADASLQDDIFHIRPRKCRHPHAKEEFEIRGMPQFLFFHLPCRFLHLVKCFKKRLIVYLYIVHANPLIDGYQMRRGKESGVLSFRHQDGLKICAHRSFSISPCHMDDLAVRRRISKPS